jgi:glucan endo-1,3-alpha-glucosidase
MVGAVSFDAWPNAGEMKKTTDEDDKYRVALGGKTYMMGVSPYFYTRWSSLGCLTMRW